MTLCCSLWPVGIHVYLKACRSRDSWERDGWNPASIAWVPSSVNGGQEEGKVCFSTVQTWLQAMGSSEECAEDGASPTSRQVLRALNGWHGTEVAWLLWGLGDMIGVGYSRRLSHRG